MKNTVVRFLMIQRQSRLLEQFPGQPGDVSTPLHTGNTCQKPCGQSRLLEQFPGQPGDVSTPLHTGNTCQKPCGTVQAVGIVPGIAGRCQHSATHRKHVLEQSKITCYQSSSRYYLSQKCDCNGSALKVNSRGILIG